MKSLIGTTNTTPARPSARSGGVERHRLHMTNRVGHLGRNLRCAKSPVNCLAEGCNCPSSPICSALLWSQWKMLNSTLCYLSVQQLAAERLSLRQAVLSVWWAAAYRLLSQSNLGCCRFSCFECLDFQLPFCFSFLPAVLINICFPFVLVVPVCCPPLHPIILWGVRDSTAICTRLKLVQVSFILSSQSGWGEFVIVHM